MKWIPGTRTINTHTSILHTLQQAAEIEAASFKSLPEKTLQKDKPNHFAGVDTNKIL